MRNKRNTIKEIVENLRPIDDIFFQKLVEQNGFCEELLQVILKKDDLKLIKITPQKSLRNIKARSVVLDVLCVDLENKYYNIEVQKSDDDDHLKRVRYNSANIDTYITEKGTEYKDLPDVSVIYISEFDVFKKGKTIYHVEKILTETNDRVDCGLHEVYINAKIDDKSDIADLMKIFKSREIPNDKRFPNICNVIREFKEEKGSGNMCKLVDDYAREYAEEREQNLIAAILEMKKGITEEELISRGFEQSTIESAKIALG